MVVRKGGGIRAVQNKGERRKMVRREREEGKGMEGREKKVEVRYS